MGALFGEYSELVREVVRYALIGVLGLVGLDSVVHGLAKLAKGPANLGGGVIEGLSLPFPTFFGVVVMLVELIGGIMLLIGLVWEVTPRRG
jgi:uncharacterized membrane protein YphA (DoxX/SURF4 family)